MPAKITVYSKPACPQCDQAKALITKAGYDYEEIILDVGQQKDPAKSYITKEELLSVIPTARMMPQVLMDGKVINVSELYML